MKTVVITGASTGIGWATSKILLDRGFRVFGSVRKQADADRLKMQFGSNFTALQFDVTDEAGVRAAAGEVRAALNGERLAGLVNNAGIAVSGPALELPIADFRRQMEINVIGQLIVTQAFGPLLGADPSLKGPPGRIVMMGSLSGQQGNPLLAPYSTSKFALEGLSESMRREFILFGIDVIVVAPGPIRTPIWDKSDEVDISIYHNSPFFPALQNLRKLAQQFGAKGLPPEAVGELVHHALTVSNPKVRYTITPDRLQNLIVGVLPKRMLDRLIAKRLGLLSKG